MKAHLRAHSEQMTVQLECYDQLVDLKLSEHKEQVAAMIAAYGLGIETKLDAQVTEVSQLLQQHLDEVQTRVTALTNSSEMYNAQSEKVVVAKVQEAGQDLSATVQLGAVQQKERDDQLKAMVSQMQRRCSQLQEGADAAKLAQENLRADLQLMSTNLPSLVALAVGRTIASLWQIKGADPIGSRAEEPAGSPAGTSVSATSDWSSETEQAIESGELSAALGSIGSEDMGGSPMDKLAQAMMEVYEPDSQ